MKRLAKHQRYASNMMDWMDYLAIWYEAGTGKTMCVLDYLYRAAERGEIKNALVVCPSSMVGSWQRAIPKMLEFEGYTPEGVQRLEKIVTVVGFPMLYTSTIRRYTNKDGREVKEREVYLREAVDHEWDIMVVDESHCIGSHSSVQTGVCLTLAGMAKRRYILSGTPVSGGKGREDFQKLFGQLKFLDDGVFKNWTQFCRRYVTSEDKWHKPASYDVEACRELMKQYGIVARLADCYDMPDYTDTLVPCMLMEPRVYEDMRKGILTKYGIEGMMKRNAGGQYIRMLQVCSGHLKIDDANRMDLRTSKLDALKDILEGTDDKVVVFCNFRASIEQTARAVAKWGYSCVVFDGQSKTETWREFQEGDAHVLICQYQAGGVGIDLFASATMVLYEPCLSSLLLEQTRARIMRKGQTRHCRYMYLTTIGTIEDKIWEKVRSGVDVTREMLDEWAKE